MGTNISFPGEKKPFHEILLREIRDNYALVDHILPKINRGAYALAIYELCLVLSNSIMEDDQIIKVILELKEMSVWSVEDEAAQNARDFIIELADFLEFSLTEKPSKDDWRKWLEKFNEWRTLKRYAFWGQKEEKSADYSSGGGCKGCGCSADA